MRQDGDLEIAAERAEDRAWGHAYRLLARKGKNAAIDEGDRERLGKEGLTPAEIDDVKQALGQIKARKFAAPSRFKLEQLLEAVGAAATPGNLANAWPVYFEALAFALLDTEARYDAGRLPYAELVRQLKHAAEANVTADLGPFSLPATAPTVRDASAPPQKRVDARAKAEPIPEPSTEQPAPACIVDDRPTIVGAVLIEKSRQDERWSDKTAGQAHATFDLFDRFLREEYAVGLTGLRQAHIEAFDTFLRSLFKSHGKSQHDKSRSISDLRKLSLDKPEDQRGLAGGTRNRHLTFIGQLLRYARRTGVPIDRDIVIAEFRAKRTKRARDDRATPKAPAVQKLFQAPIFTGCVGWDDQYTVGDFVFHRAAYFGPMLAVYQGCRREEFCGLAVEDVVVNNGPHPYIHIRPNKFRRIKNPQSERVLALHPEIIRVRFLEYVAAISALGYDRIFPDLYSPGTKSSLGDRLYDELLPAFKDAGCCFPARTDPGFPPRTDPA